LHDKVASARAQQAGLTDVVAITKAWGLILEVDVKARVAAEVALVEVHVGQGESPLTRGEVCGDLVSDAGDEVDDIRHAIARSVWGVWRVGAIGGPPDAEVVPWRGQTLDRHGAIAVAQVALTVGGADG